MYAVLVVGRFELVSSVNKIDSGVYSLRYPGVRFSFMFFISAFRSYVLSLPFQTFVQLTSLKVMREIWGIPRVAG